MFVEDWNMAFVGRLELFRQDILHVILATRVVYYGANGHVIFGGGIYPAHEIRRAHRRCADTIICSTKKPACPK